MKLKIKEFMPDLGFLGPVLGVIAVGIILYFMYWIFKTGSYFFFYESMVEGTIRDMVIPAALK